MYSIPDGNILDLVGTPIEVEADDLEEKVVVIFEKLACKFPTEGIEACPRTSKRNSKAIVNFSRKKDCQQVWDVMRDLQKIKMENIGLHVIHQ